MFRPNLQRPIVRRPYVDTRPIQGTFSRRMGNYMQLGRAGADGSSRNGGDGAEPLVKVKLPMQSINGKRPVVELVIEQNGRYQPIKFSNNMQVTESIPKSKFDEANDLRKTCYLKATQVPRVGGKPLLLAINPSAAAAHRLKAMAEQQQVQRQQQQIQRQQLQQRHQHQRKQNLASAVQRFADQRPLVKSSAQPQPTDQVSILVRPAKSASQKPVLLNVPRKVALKVKPGTTLSFSASNDQKYTVIDSKIHPPVKMPGNAISPTKASRPPPQQQQRQPQQHNGGRRQPLQLPPPPSHIYSALNSRIGGGILGGGVRRPGLQTQGKTSLQLQASLPKGVSIQRIGATAAAAKTSVSRAGGNVFNQQQRRRPVASSAAAAKQPAVSNVLSSGEV
jgi:hypothetical protein